MKKLQIIGNIAKDAEKKENKGGKTFLSFSVGINENYKDANGEWVDKTQWVNCQLYGERWMHHDLPKAQKSIVMAN